MLAEVGSTGKAIKTCRTDGVTRVEARTAEGSWYRVLSRNGVPEDGNGVVRNWHSLPTATAALLCVTLDHPSVTGLPLRVMPLVLSTLAIPPHSVAPPRLVPYRCGFGTGADTIRDTIPFSLLSIPLPLSLSLGRHGCSRNNAFWSR